MDIDGKFIKWLLAAAFLVAAGVGAAAVVNRLDDDVVLVLAAATVTVVGFLVVGGLFIAFMLAQGYVARRHIAQDDLNDLKQMALLHQIMGAPRSPNVSVKMPDQLFLPGASGYPPALEGTYRDAMGGNGVEIE